MTSSILRSIKMTLVLAVLLGGVYPATVWLLGQGLFSTQANGSLVRQGGVVVGSELIGQAFVRPEYLHGRPSAAGEKGYDAAASGGSNLGPTNQKLADRVTQDVAKLVAENPGLAPGQVPVDLVTTSGSGLDPHISPAAAEVQVNRIAQARRLPAEKVREFVAANTERPQWGIFGESRVNVLKVNLALDALSGRLP
jgi:K+-transporting ATPase ATPase C chain